MLLPIGTRKLVVGATHVQMLLKVRLSSKIRPQTELQKEIKIMSFQCQTGVRDGPTWQTVAYVDYMSSLIQSGTYLF